MKIKEFFKNAKTKVSELKVIVGIKSFFNRIFNGNTATKVKEDATNTATGTREFIKNHNNIKDMVSGDVMHRFQKKIKGWFKNFTKKTNEKSEKSTMVNIGRIALKVVCIIAAIAFVALVIYCIKDVFMYCLMMVATCAAVILCIEFILWVLSTALGCKI